MKLDERFPIPGEWLTDEDGMLVVSVERWAEREVSSLRSKHREDFEALHAPALHGLMTRVGLVDLIWPDADDDGEVSAVTWAAVLEQVGRADVGLGVLLASTVALQRCVPAALKPRLGEKGAIAALVLPEYARRAGEPGPGWLHGLAPQVEVSRGEGGFTLSGKAVRPQAHGARASFFGVVGSLDGEPALLAVPADAKGLTLGEPFLKTGLHASLNADLELKTVAVDEDHLLFQGSAGWNRLQGDYLLGCAAAASGGQLALHAILDDWCDSRVIKGRGQRFKDNPLVGALLGEVGGALTTGRVLLFQLARHLDGSGGEGDVDLATAVALTRAIVRGAMDSLDRAMELMASAGYATEWNLERYWRDTKTLATYLHLETAGLMVLANHCFGCAEL